MTITTTINGNIKLSDFYEADYMNKYIIAFDLETNPSGDICYMMLGTERTVYIWYNQADFIRIFLEFIKALNATTYDFYIYAHNGGRFDFVYLLKALDRDYEYTLAPDGPNGYNMLIVNNRIININIGPNVQLRDSMSLYNGSLESFSSGFGGIKKLSGTYDYDIIRNSAYFAHPYNVVSDLPYITTDIISLVTAIKTFNSLTFCNPDLCDLHRIPLTAGSGSYSMLLDDTYKTDTKIWRPTNIDGNSWHDKKAKDYWLNNFVGTEDEHAEELERIGYIGGYVSANALGRGLYVRICDISSAYPDKLVNSLLPIGKTQNLKCNNWYYDNFTEAMADLRTHCTLPRPKMWRKCKLIPTLGMTLKYSVLANLKHGQLPALSSGGIGFGAMRSIVWDSKSDGSTVYTSCYSDLITLDKRYKVYGVDVQEVNFYWMLPGLYTPMGKYYQYKQSMKAVNKGAYNASKIVINSPTGKFGERDHYKDYNCQLLDEKIETVNSWQRNKKGEWQLLPCYAYGEYFTYINGKKINKLWYSSRFDENWPQVLKKIKSEKSRRHTSVKTISNITAGTRTQLNEAAGLLEHGGNDVIYTDTDSLFVLASPHNNTVLDKLESDKLGGWECGPIVQVFIFGLKQYLIENDTGILMKWVGISDKNKLELVERYANCYIKYDEKGNMVKLNGCRLMFSDLSLENMFDDYNSGRIHIMINRMVKNEDGNMMMVSRDAKINSKKADYDRRID